MNFYYYRLNLVTTYRHFGCVQLTFQKRNEVVFEKKKINNIKVVLFLAKKSDITNTNDVDFCPPSLSIFCMTEKIPTISSPRHKRWDEIRLLNYSRNFVAMWITSVNTYRLYCQFFASFQFFFLRDVIPSSQSKVSNLEKIR